MERKKTIYFSVFNIAIVIIAIFIIYSDLPKEQAIIYEHYEYTENSSNDSNIANLESTAISSKDTEPIKTTSLQSQTSTSEIVISSSISESPPQIFPLNLNLATTEQLTNLNGIGETLAKRIIDYRNSIGIFINRYQLLNVDGIGDKKLSSIYNDIYIENEQPLSPETEITIEAQEDNIEYESPQEEYIPAETIAEIIYINLNTATLDDLIKIPNMDAQTAQQVLDLRQQIQYFSHIYELLYVDTISENRLSEMQEYIYVE